MRTLIIYLAFLLFLGACGTSLVPIRYSVEGQVFNSQTNQPIDSVEIGFFIDPYNSKNTNLEKKYYSNENGNFKIPEISKKTYPEQARRLKEIYEKYLRISKEGYKIDTIDIKDTIYRVDKEKITVYLDTIYLKPINNY